MLRSLSVLDILPVAGAARWRLHFGRAFMPADEILLPFCRIKKFYLPYYDGINERKLSKIISKLRREGGDADILLSAQAARLPLAAFAPYRRAHTDFYMSLLVVAARRVMQCCRQTPDRTCVYLKTDRAPSELCDLLIELCGMAKEVYVAAASQEGLDETLTRVFEETGACVVPGGMPDMARGFTIALITSGLREFLEQLPPDVCPVVLNFSDEELPHRVSFAAADGLIFHAEMYSLLKRKGISETDVVRSLNLPPEELGIAGFTLRGEPVYLRGARGS